MTTIHQVNFKKLFLIIFTVEHAALQMTVPSSLTHINRRYKKITSFKEVAPAEVQK